MAKIKTQFACDKCHAVAPKWQGQCPGCGEWNTLVEDVQVQAPKGAAARQGYAGGGGGKLVTLSEIEKGSLIRLPTGMSEFDRVLGGGLVAGGTVVMGGNPGAGKSTILLQTGCVIARQRKVHYYTGEESLEQIKDRAERLSLPQDRMWAVVETNVVAIGAMLEREAPDLAIVDSVQALYHPELPGEPGGVSQVKNCAAYLNRIAKHLGIALVLVGHINKSDAIAGPMALLHIVDAVLMFSSTDDARYRILRAEKNRFGPTSEIGVFAMTGTGVKVVENPSAIFLSRTVKDAPGSVVTSLWEGSRPMLVEVQSLLDASGGGNPRRVSVGIDDKRIAMLMAVMNRHSGLQVSDQDVYVNVVGGVRVTETCADLPVLLTAASSFKSIVIPEDVMAFGELGLSGEVRPCANGQDRIREAVKLGFTKAVVPLANCPKEGVPGLDIFPVSTVAHAMEWLSGL